MHELRLGDLKVRLVGGPDRQGGGNGPMVVLLHGFGAPGTDLLGLWRQIRVPSEVRFAFPEAPLTLDQPLPVGDARAWWRIDMGRLQTAIMDGRFEELAEAEPEGLEQAREHLTRMLDALQEQLGVPSHQLVVGGFSQGAMLACDFALSDPRPLAGLVLMSSTLLGRQRWQQQMPTRAGLGVLQSHGRADPLLPFPLAEQLRDMLRSAGLPVTWIAFNGGHGVADNVIDALGPFITRATPSPPRS